MTLLFGSHKAWKNLKDRNNYFKYQFESKNEEQFVDEWQFINKREFKQNRKQRRFQISKNDIFRRIDDFDYCRCEFCVLNKQIGTMYNESMRLMKRCLKRIQIDLWKSHDSISFEKKTFSFVFESTTSIENFE